MNDTELQQLSTCKRLPVGWLELLAIALVPWCLWPIAHWPVTPVGAIDAWIYRGVGPNMIVSHQIFPHFYNTARLFLLLPAYALSHVFDREVTHIILAFAYCYATLLGIYDLTSSVAAAGTRTLAVFFSVTSLYLLRSAGWGYADGFLVAMFSVGWALLASSVLAESVLARRLYAAAAGGLLIAMVGTHPMTGILGLVLGCFLTNVLRPLGRNGVSRAVEIGIAMIAGGAAMMLSACLISEWLWGTFLFFEPIISTAIYLRTAMRGFKLDPSIWPYRADWLCTLLLAYAASLVLMIAAAVRRQVLNAFEWSVYLGLFVMLTIVAALELWTANVYLQFSFFAVYFLPLSILVLAAVLGERGGEDFSWRTKAALLLVLLLMVPGILAVKRAFLDAVSAPPGDPLAPPVGMINMFYLQLVIGAAGMVVAVVLRFVPRAGGGRGGAIGVCGAVILLAAATVPPISSYPSPRTAEEVAVSYRITRVQQLVQETLGPIKPYFWYAQSQPFFWEFSSIHSAYLWASTLYTFSFPEARVSDGHIVSTSFQDHEIVPWQAGETIVVMTPNLGDVAAGRASFLRAGWDLQLIRQQWIAAGDNGYWIVFLKTAPSSAPRVLRAGDVDSLMPGTLVGVPNDGQQVRVAKAEQGCLAVGNFGAITPGSYGVYISLALQEPAGSNDNVANIAVFADGNVQPLVQRQLTTRDFPVAGKMMDFNLMFTTNKPAKTLQFILLKNGSHPLAFRGIRLVPQAAAAARP